MNIFREWNRIKHKGRGFIERWLDARIPGADSVVLNEGRIFILPTRFGYLLLLLVVIIFLLGLNYGNSLAFALSFLLLSLFLVAIWETFYNLRGLRLSKHHNGHGFAGEEICFGIQLNGPGHRSLRLGWPVSGEITADILRGKSHHCHLYYPARRRGRLHPGRFRISSRYPLGLLEAWSWIDLGFSALVYPEPLPSPVPDGGWSSDEGRGKVTLGQDDFAGFRRYQPGDPISQIAWKKRVKGDALITKQFISREDSRNWLCWEQTHGGVEMRLSQLCYWVLESERRQQAYGLQMPAQQVEIGLGVAQQKACLRQLALFGEGQGDE
ncbi:DUF58 domain-containing protein [Dongshaea marina]|uniref:DUF58 domain-containing protein n=1 Tax=Dongshaea marina TaxID=2047966 RepID=UPI000D3E69A2|nr:DUF58 domain-containing protein [Dongshaea marina]